MRSGNFVVLPPKPPLTGPSACAQWQRLPQDEQQHEHEKRQLPKDSVRPPKHHHRRRRQSRPAAPPVTTRARTPPPLPAHHAEQSSLTLYPADPQLGRIVRSKVKAKSKKPPQEVKRAKFGRAFRELQNERIETGCRIGIRVILDQQPRSCGHWLRDALLFGGRYANVLASGVPAGPDLLHQPKRPGKQITFVVGSKVLASHRKRRTRNTASK